MTQLSLFSVNSRLMVRDQTGDFALASPEQILQAARQIIDQKMQRGQAFSAPTIAEDYLRAKLAGLEHEVFAVLMLDARHRLIAYVEMFRGSISSATVEPREVLKECMRHNAAAILIGHNHPSGDATPSSADITLTKRLRAALDLVDVRVLDHIVVGGNTTVSMASRGLI
jgi:DNA repair protein RadC